MNTDELNIRLGDTLQDFNREIRFHLDTFEQHHDNENLTKHDFEEMGRQVFYCLSAFRDDLIGFLRKERV